MSELCCAIFVLSNPYFCTLEKFLVIQTSFIGDVILATAVLEKLHAHYPNAQIDVCLRKGNEGLFVQHPFIGKVHIWDKKNNKLKNLWQLSKKIRNERYDVAINLQRFASSGFLMVRSGATEKIGFKKNPLSFLFTRSFEHEISAHGTKHETERNQKLIEHLTDKQVMKPKLYPTQQDFRQADDIIQNENLSAGAQKYITISPASVWFTKQLPKEKFVELIKKINQDIKIYLLGGPADKAYVEEIRLAAQRPLVQNLAGQLSLLGSAALMQRAQMNYVNDSAPLHLCSAMNAPVSAFFCSTVPAFGFTPLSDESYILETKEELSCRPCGLHGFKSCPQGHFKCSLINLPELV